MHKLTDLPSECPHRLVAHPISGTGCWFCGETCAHWVPESFFFSMEWDTFAHYCCLRRAAEEGLDPEVETMLEELEISHA